MPFESSKFSVMGDVKNKYKEEETALVMYLL